MRLEPIVTSGAMSMLRFDNLRPAMRDVYYRLLVIGIRATHIHTAPPVMAGYEGLLMAEPDPTTVTAPPVTFFKDLPVLCDPGIPEDELHFMRRDELVAKVRGIN